MRKYLLLFFVAMSATAFGQTYIQGSLNGGPPVPGPKYRSNLNTMERTVNLAGVTILTDTFGNQRFALYVHVEDTCINYTPTPTGNVSNLSAFVEKCGTDSLWYIDWAGASIFISARNGGEAACDQDWLTISTDTCPTSINDSIYHQKYASVGARYVWPGATFLVNDSSNVNGALQVIQGDRVVKLALYDLTNEQWVMLHGNNTDMSVYVPQDGSFTVTTASGTPENATADVPHFTVSSLDSTVTLNQYPNTRRDTQTIANFLYTDDLGVIRSQSVDSFPLAGRGGIYGGSGLIPDSTSAEVAFGGFFQIAYPSGVFDPAIRVTDNPPTVERQVEINSTNATIQVYPNNVTVEAQDGINMLSNDGTENEGIFFCTPYSVGFSLDSTAPNVGWSRVYSEPEFSEMQASDGGTGGVAILRTYKSTGGGGPNVLGTVSYSTATYPTNAINIDTLGVRVQTFGSYGNTGQVLRNVGGWLQWQDTSAAAASVNIYNSDGTISTNRTVTLSDTVLWDIASAAGAFHIEGLNNSYFRQSDNAIVTGTGGASFNLGSGTPIAMSMSLDAGTARVTDNRAGKVGIEYASAGYGADFTDSTLVHRRYVGKMIEDSLANITYSSITPSTLTARADDWNPTGLSSANAIFAAGDNSFQIITGISAPTGNKSLVINNIGDYPILFSKEDNRSSASNRFLFETDFVLQQNNSVTLFYNTNKSRWSLIGGQQLLENTGYNSCYGELRPIGTSASSNMQNFNANANSGSITLSGGTGITQSSVLSTGASSTASPNFNVKAGAAFAFTSSSGNATYVRYISKIKFTSSLSDGSETYFVRVGFTTQNNHTSGEPTSGCYFRYTHSEASGNWVAVNRNSGTETGTATDTGVAVALSTWYTLEVVKMPDGYIVFRINGAEVARQNGNVSTASQSAYTQLMKTVGSTARTIEFIGMKFYVTGIE